VGSLVSPVPLVKLLLAVLLTLSVSAMCFLQDGHEESATETASAHSSDSADTITEDLLFPHLYPKVRHPCIPSDWISHLVVESDTTDAYHPIPCSFCRQSIDLSFVRSCSGHGLARGQAR